MEDLVIALRENSGRKKVERRKILKGTVVALAGVAASSLLKGFEPVSSQSAGTTGIEPPRNFIFVIDLDKCDGCRKCTEGCHAEMHVPPAWGEPNYEGRQPWIQVFDLPDGTHMPVPCQNCQNSPCTKVCPVGATYYSEDNIVLIDQNRCIGCRICLASCPYERRFFNWYDPPVTEEEKKIQYSPDFNIPHRRGVAEKCVWCRHRTKMGMVPACVEACARAGMKALWFGDEAQDVVSNGVDSVRLSDMIQDRGAYRFKDELGTSPRVLYLPPRGSASA